MFINPRIIFVRYNIVQYVAVVIYLGDALPLTVAFTYRPYVILTFVVLTDHRFNFSITLGNIGKSIKIDSHFITPLI